MPAIERKNFFAGEKIDAVSRPLAQDIQLVGRECGRSVAYLRTISFGEADQQSRKICLNSAREKSNLWPDSMPQQPFLLIYRFHH